VTGYDGFGVDVAGAADSDIGLFGFGISLGLRLRGTGYTSLAVR